jgi:hypothetical protein
MTSPSITPASPPAPVRDRLADLVRDPVRGCHIGVGTVKRTWLKRRVKSIEGLDLTLCGIPWSETGQHPGGYYFRDVWASGRCPECGGPLCRTCYARRFR